MSGLALVRMPIDATNLEPTTLRVESGRLGIDDHRVWALPTSWRFDPSRRRACLAITRVFRVAPCASRGRLSLRTRIALPGFDLESV